MPEYESAHSVRFEFLIYFPKNEKLNTSIYIVFFSFDKLNFYAFRRL